MSKKQRTGQTTQQMLDAPKGAHYVWYCSALSYPRQLAEHLGRKDLNIVSPNFFSRKGRGYRLKTKIITDHGCVFTVTQATEIDRCNVLKGEI